ncbi:LysR family transcriptional regulator [Enterovibrio paralichthyis]|uniref:LysR family transcriptional regulator n=1 Tax=Enterovibrio paralichthyis TaxID=2853805 RepID=UPI001C4376EF|nr:LysR family transcriptional regulator [Enterovibrio paralichthyis]MBV7298085.1 LysR family transcriptional regulator [Enterovibrio paralichthyis]
MEQLHQQLPNIYVFRLVSELGSFQAAANQLGLPRSSVSKKVSQLEQYMEQRLLQRSTRKLRLTEDGLRLMNATESLGQLVGETRHLLMEGQAEPAGRVVISTSTLIGRQYLTPHVKALRQRFPKITLQLDYSDDVVDLLEAGVDIAIRTGKLPDSTLVARPIGTKTHGTFAAPSYLAEHGKPKTPHQLKDHDCMVFKNNAATMNHWHFTHPNGEIQSVEVKGAIVGNDGRAMVDLAVEGLGIVTVDPNTISEEIAQGKLVPILTEWQSPENKPVQLVCLGRETRSKAVDAVWRFLAEALSDNISPAISVDGKLGAGVSSECQ